MISYRIVENKSNIDWRYMQDVLFNPNIIPSSEEEFESLKLLRKYLCKVVLDFQVDNHNHPNNKYSESQKYLQKYGISFTKYAKKILADALGSEIAVPVGIIYTQHQVFYDQILRECEIQYTDFQIISVTYMPHLRMPLNFDLFEEHFVKILGELKRQSLDAGISFNRSHDDAISFMVIWKGAKNISNIETMLNFPELHKTEIEFFNSKEKEYLWHLQSMVIMDFHFRFKRISIVSGTLFNVRKFSSYLLREGDHSYKLQEILPSLHVQETNVSPCQLKYMLNGVSTMFENLVVDEYTWNTVIRYYDQLTDIQLMKETCKYVRPKAPLPTNVMLFASNGIGEYWNYTGKTFESLLWSNPNIGEINLTTIVFSAYDVYWSTPKSERLMSYDERSTNYGISKFVKSWKEANMTRVGFLVDISKIVDEGHFHVDKIERLARILCGNIFEQADVSVWEYKVNGNLTSAYNFTYGLEDGNLKVVLIKMLIAREMFLSRYPEKEVIFSINTDNLLETSGNYSKSCKYSGWKEDLDMNWLLFEWSRINGVKILYRPAYDLRNPRNGYFSPPSNNGDYNRYYAQASSEC